MKTKGEDHMKLKEVKVEMSKWVQNVNNWKSANIIIECFALRNQDFMKIFKNKACESALPIELFIKEGSSYSKFGDLCSKSLSIPVE